MSHQRSLLNSISESLSEKTGESIELKWVRELHGGDINQAALIRSDQAEWFLKYHTNAPDDMFPTEAQALAEISSQKCIKAPLPIALGVADNTAWLVLEYLELTASGPASLLGEQLAAMHRVSMKYFGWKRDNYIGSTVQVNTSSDSWADFWVECRMKPQLALVEAAGFGSKILNRAENLLAEMNHVLGDHQPKASLLHGDLWSGNKAFTRDGQAVIFDPASYYGDRETDIAMTELFGGFDPDFLSAYRAHYPLPDEYYLRRDLYNLYHMLNHLNLFGSGYLSRCVNMIDSLMAQIR